MSFDQMMIHYSAPTLCGIKPGNLFFIKGSDFSESQLYIWKKKFENCGYWKSYSDVENAKKCLCKYKKCSRMGKNAGIGVKFKRVFYYPSATSSTIIKAKPTAKPIVQTSVFSSRVASGISSSITT